MEGSQDYTSLWAAQAPSATVQLNNCCRMPISWHQCIQASQEAVIRRKGTQAMHCHTAVMHLCHFSQQQISEDAAQDVLMIQLITQKLNVIMLNLSQLFAHQVC